MFQSVVVPRLPRESAIVLSGLKRSAERRAEALSPSFKDKAKSLLRRLRYDFTHWQRVEQVRLCRELLRTLDLPRMDAIEISAGGTYNDLPFKSFMEANFPEHDICEAPVPGQWDLVLADQVFEHLTWPYRAGRHVHQMLRPGGYFLVATPFLVRVHDVPIDCSRWTETGLRHFLAECGFPLEPIRTGSWGNRRCVKAMLRAWPARRGWFGSLKNEPLFPVNVWALAKKEN
jgi:SAM-dependent methyltransferase